VVITNDGHYAYVVNAGGGPDATLANYRLASGNLTFLGLTPENNANGDEIVRTNALLSRDSKYLYVVKPGLMGPVSQVDIYRRNHNGSLTLIGNTPANGAPGQSGLAGR
jgi:6-phosphogluconolactonase (cycloisomerase 2 family)